MLFALMLLSGRAHATDSSKNQQPHIVMFVVDDLGWGDVGFHRAVPTREVQTPFMDSLVSTGIELTRYGARQDFALEDAIGSHACSLEASMRVTNGIPLGC